MKPTNSKKLDDRLKDLRKFENPKSLKNFKTRVGPEFAKKVDAWLKRKDNRDSADKRTQVAIKKAIQYCDNFWRAVRATKHEDSQVQLEAQKALRTIPIQEFPELAERLRRLRGQINKAGQRQNERKKRAGERTISLNDRYELHEMKSLSSLQRAGQDLRNCLANKKEALYYLNDRDTRMWALRNTKERQTRCVMQVDISRREIDECLGPDNDTPKLKRRIAFEILRALGVSGDGVEAFHRIGAFGVFLGGEPPVEPVKAGRKEHRIWRWNDGADIVIATRSRPGKRELWSRFTRGKRRGPGRFLFHNHSLLSKGHNHLSAGDLLRLVLDNPGVYERLRTSSA